MRKLIVLVALSLGALSARAQAPSATTVTKLPGEEKLSMRERAERDFLMPVRRKKAAELARPTASAEQLTTSAPENDALTNYNEAAPDPRPEVAAAETHEASASHSRAARHAAWLAARRERRAAEARAEARAEAKAEARRAARHSSKSGTAKAKHTSKASKSSASRSKSAKAKTSKAKRHAEETHHSKKSTAHKASKTHKAEATKSKHHTATAKTKTKDKPAKRKKRR